MTLDFEPVAHEYRLDGQVLPSVTGVLRASGLINFDGIPAGILEAAQRRGTTVHAAIHYFNEHDLDVGQFVADFPDYAGYLQAWIAFCSQRRFEAVLCERRLASPRHRVAGTADAFGLLDGVRCLVDFKTGNPDDVAADLQTGAYLGMAYEWADHDPELAEFLKGGAAPARYSVQLRRDGTFKLELYRNPSDYSEFLSLVSARRIVERRKGEAVAWAA